MTLTEQARLIGACESVFGVEDIMVRSRKRDLVDARRVAAIIMKDSGMKYAQIVRAFKNEWSHNAIVYLVISGRKLLAHDEKTRRRHKIIDQWLTLNSQTTTKTGTK